MVVRGEHAGDQQAKVTRQQELWSSFWAAYALFERPPYRSLTSPASFKLYLGFVRFCRLQQAQQPSDTELCQELVVLGY